MSDFICTRCQFGEHGECSFLGCTCEFEECRTYRVACLEEGLTDAAQ